MDKTVDDCFIRRRHRVLSAARKCPLSAPNKEGTRKGCLGPCSLRATPLPRRRGALCFAKSETLAEESAPSALVSKLPDADRLDYLWTRTQDQPVILHSAQVRVAPLVLRTTLGFAKPPRSNLRAARLCEHRLARAGLCASGSNRLMQDQSPKTCQKTKSTREGCFLFSGGALFTKVEPVFDLFNVSLSQAKSNP